MSGSRTVLGLRGLKEIEERIGGSPNINGCELVIRVIRWGDVEDILFT